MNEEFEINQINLVGWGDIPIELIVKIQRELEKFYCGNIVVLFEPQKGLFIELTTEQDEVISWKEMYDKGIVGALNAFVLPGQLSIVVDYATGKSPGLIFNSHPELETPEQIDQIYTKAKYNFPLWDIEEVE